MEVLIKYSLLKTYYINLHCIFRVIRTHDSLRMYHIINSHQMTDTIRRNSTYYLKYTSELCFFNEVVRIRTFNL